MAIKAENRLLEIAADNDVFKKLVYLQDVSRSAAAAKLKSLGYKVTTHSGQGSSGITAEKNGNSYYIEIEAHPPTLGD